MLSDQANGMVIANLVDAYRKQSGNAAVDFISCADLVLLGDLRAHVGIHVDSVQNCAGDQYGLPTRAGAPDYYNRGQIDLEFKPTRFSGKVKVTILRVRHRATAWGSYKEFGEREKRRFEQGIIASVKWINHNMQNFPVVDLTNERDFTYQYWP